MTTLQAHRKVILCGELRGKKTLFTLKGS